MDPTQLRAQILNAIRADNRFVACVEYGSASEGRADEWSDVDLAFFVRDWAVEELNLNWKEWAKQFGSLLLTLPGAQNHPWAVYDAKPCPLRADFAFHPESKLEFILEWPNAPISIDAMVLYDDTGGRLREIVRQIVGQDLGPVDLPLTYEQVCGGFWYYLLRLEGRVQRGELWAAAWQFNYIVIAQLCAIFKIQHGALARFRSSDSTAGIEQIVTPSQLRRLRRCVAGPDVGELRRAMLEAVQLGREVCADIQTQRGWAWPEELAARLVELNREGLASDDVIALYDHVADRYNQSVSQTEYIVPAWLDDQLVQLELPTKLSLLDLGCANGINTRRILKNYPQATAIGIDISPKMAQAAKSSGVFREVFVHDIGQPLHFLEADMVDLAIAFGCLEFVRSPQTCLNEIARVLRSDGLWLASFQLYVEGRDDAPRNMRSGLVVHHAYAEEEIRTMVSAANLTCELMEQVIGYTGGAPCHYVMVRGAKQMPAK